jgi:2,3-bisphosphoglycerate-independent phosphoglycerate mutase
MEDYSAGHITTEDAEHFIKLLEQKMGSAQIAFYPGKSYRHLVVLKTHQTEHLTQLRCTPPHDITGKAVESYLPQGNGKEMILALMEEAHTILRDHPLNAGREAPVTDIWLWGQGTKPNLPRFTDKFGVKGAIISAVDLVNGIGRLAGLDVITVPGATGYYDTDYRAKAEYALEALKSRDFVYVHVEAPDEAGHNGDAKAKTEAIENFDRDIVGPVLAAYAKEDMRVLVLPDHPTPVAKRTHTSDPVPFVMYGHGIEAGNGENYSESFARTLGIKFVSGEALVRQFMNA